MLPFIYRSKALCMVAGIALGARAAIVDIAPFTGPFTATNTSAITVVFHTAPTIIIRCVVTVLSLHGTGSYTVKRGLLGCLWRSQAQRRYHERRPWTPVGGR